MSVGRLQGLKAFVVNHPPLVVFTACIFLFGISTIVLAFIVSRSDLPNPDITVDWNVFLSHLTERNLCVHTKNITKHQKIHSSRKSSNSVIPTSNSTINVTVATTPEPLIGVEELSLSELLPDISSLKIGRTQSGPSINVTKSMIVPLSFDSALLSLPSYVTWLRGQVTGRHVGYTGQLSKETIHVNMFLPYNLKRKPSSCHGDPNCKIKLNVCMVFFGPATLIPKTRQFKGCRHWTDDVKNAANTTWYLPDFIPKQCTGKIQLKMQYDKDPTLTAMLNNIDKTIVNLHLMNTSYMIFVVLITMLAYTLIKSHFRNTKILSSEKVSL